MSVNQKKITEITLKLASGTELSADEQALLDDYLAAHPDNPRRLEERISRQQVERGLEGMKEGEDGEEASWSRISRNQVNRSSFTGRRVIYWRPFASAAAVVLAVAGAWLLWLQAHKAAPRAVPTNYTAASDVQPGGNKATLTLSNGLQIILSDVATGDLAQQGGTKITKHDSGQLRYTILNEKPGGAKELAYNTLTTPISGMFRVVLPDGTRVWLNSASSLRYPTSFEGLTNREVVLKGEAYFEVSRDPSRPFRVKVNEAMVNVLGTDFNVMAYGDEPAVRTTLLAGSVNVTLMDRRVMLKPGQQASLGREGSLTVGTVDVNSVVAWKNGFFNFDHADVPAVMRQLTRWFGVEPVYTGAVPDRHFFGLIDRNLSLAQVLKVLEANGIHCTIENKRLLIAP